jgi:hypothetical protein
MNETRNIKDSLFTEIFNNEEAARELYNAINDTHHGPETPVTMTTLENVLYNGVKNDVSFTIDGVSMALFEQQSSFNQNIPLRILIYTARVYERTIPNKELHKDKRVMIPCLQAVMFHIGKDSGKGAMKTNRAIMRLSRSYLGAPGRSSSLDLEVLVLNIMRGFNKRILRRSPLLWGYVTFVTRFRDIKKRMPREQAILATVDWCIAHNILADFLRAHHKEVSNMTLNELTIDDALEAVREETWEEAQKRVIALVKKGYTGERLEQAILSERLHVLPKTTRTRRSSKR